MTTIITRVFPDEAAAKHARERLLFRGLPSRALTLITGGDDAEAQMHRAKVDDSAIAAYAKALKSGNAVLVARTTYIPLTAATITRDTLARYQTVDMGDVVEEHYMPDGPEKAGNVLKGHPLMLSARPSVTGYEGGPVTGGLGFRLLSARKPRTSAIRGGGFKSRMFWPMPLLSHKARTSSVIRGGRHVSSMFWPMPLLSRRQRGNSVIHGGDLPLSRALGWPPIS